jgi:hypothetical protein
LKWRKEFRKANERFFYGMLEPTKVIVSKKKRWFRGAMHEHAGGYRTITLYKRKGMYETLLHEMVHVYQAQFHPPEVEDHGDTFQVWVKFFEQIGYDIR